MSEIKLRRRRGLRLAVMCVRACWLGYGLLRRHGHSRREAASLAARLTWAAYRGAARARVLPDA